MRHGMKLIPREGGESSGDVRSGSGRKKPFGDRNRPPLRQGSDDLVCSLLAAATDSRAAAATGATATGALIGDGGDVAANGRLLGRPDRRQSGRDSNECEGEEGGGEGGERT